MPERSGPAEHANQQVTRHRPSGLAAGFLHFVPAMKQVLVVMLLCVSAAAVASAAKIKVKAEGDPQFDFSMLRTFAWDDDAGEVIIARRPDDNPAEVKSRIDPLIRKHVAAAMVKKGLSAAGQTPDVHLHYYVLVSLNATDQTMGQFLPAVPYWGLPAFAPATQALTVVTRGSLVLDALLPGTVGERRVIWRGVAQSTVQDTDSDAVRDERIRDAAAELIKRFPLKKK